jgi:hypothetical protein
VLGDAMSRRGARQFAQLGKIEAGCAGRLAGGRVVRKVEHGAARAEASESAKREGFRKLNAASI